jgi:type I restriction enzyme S subunit
MKHYDSYKESGIDWIGEIPSHWEIRRNKYFTKVVNIKSEDGSEELLSVSEHKGVIPRKEIKEDGELTRSESLEGYKVVKENQLVSNIMLTWKCGLGVSNYEGIVSPAYSVFSFLRVIPRYYHYLYRTSLYTSEFMRNSTGVIESRLRLYDDKFGDIFSHYPPLSEQEQIVFYLDDKTTKIDELIQKKLRKIDLLKEYRTSLINTVVTKGLNPDVPMKDSGIEWIGEIPSHWETSKYKTLGNRFTQNIDVSVFQNQEVIHYSIPNVQENGIGILESGEDIDSSKILLKGGELIISKLNPRKSCVSIVEPNNDFLIVGSGEFVTLVPDKGNIKFLFYFVKSQQFTEYLDSCVESVTRSHQRVNPYIIYSSLIPLPPLSEQEQIVSYLDEKTSQIDKTIDIEKKKIELLKEYRQSLISNVVIGKIKVSESV